jgi:hypothetical protein
VTIIPVLFIFRQEFDIRWHDIWRTVLIPVYPLAIVGASMTFLLMRWRTPNNIIESLRVVFPAACGVI